jgi:serine/threonine protein kinase/Tol biopolymer transport system component
MGEVYRARDTRIGRDVAIKVLPEDFVANADRLMRFQREAQSAGSLNHPNLLTIHELGSENGRTFIVAELLDGVTLRERLLGGALAPRRAIEYATQIAAGLAAAHERGIVHRDLKPENIFITRDGRLKILDFGLAKVSASVPAGISDLKTATQHSATDPGAILGTVGYMSPEQVRGEPVDARSDIFALGAILYEMVSGRRAFHASSSVDTMHAILHADPPELSGMTAAVPPALERIVNHCLEKNPEQRFQSARDLAFDLGSVSATSGESIATARRRVPGSALFWIAALIAVATASWFASRAMMRRSPPRFTRITFESKPGGHAAFSPDQQSILYSQLAPDGQESVKLTTIGGPGARDLGFTPARIMSISSRGDLALLLDPQFVGGFVFQGTLARAPVAGGAPRAILEHVQWADWTPNGEELAVLRTVNGKARIELPIGNVLYEAEGWAQMPKISPDGRKIAFIDHPGAGNDAGTIMLIDIAAKKTNPISPNYASVQTLTWSPDGRSLWFAASPAGSTAALYRVAEGSPPELMLTAPGNMSIHAIARDGRILISQSDIRMRLMFGKIGDAAERELSWLDWSLLRDITPDGKFVLFDESGEGGGKEYSVFVRPTDGGPAIRLGDGRAAAFSPDQKSVLAIRPTMEPPQVFIYPTGAGESIQVTRDAMRHTSASFTPDGKSILYLANDAKHPATLYVQDLAGGAPRAISPPGISQLPGCSPDGKWVCMRGPDSVQTLYPLQGGAAMRIPEIEPGFTFAGWSADSKQIYFVRRNVVPAPLVRVDLASRKTELLKQLTFSDSTSGVNNLRIARDGVTYAYSYSASRSDLYVVQGLR